MRRRPRKADSVPKLVLEEVIGLTTKNANGLASDASAGWCAYLAGCVVVLYDVATGGRKHLMVSSRAPKPLSCVALARQGRGFVAAGESGHMPAILIWDSSTGNLLSELKGHQSGVQSMDFSSDGKYLVSVGYLNDGYIFLWDWRGGRLMAKVKLSTTLGPVLCVSFLSEGSTFITVGRKHLKLWTLGSFKNTSTNVAKEFSSIDGKPANLGCWKGSSFISIASTASRTSKSASGDLAVDFFPMYALTETGTLCVLDHGISIGKCVDLKVEKGFALSVSESLIACACNSGIVQLFHVSSLLHVGCLYYGESKGSVDLINIACHGQPSETCPKHVDIIPDAIACGFLSTTKLAVIYADHSFYTWDIDHVHKVTKCCLLVAHSACIWDVQNLPGKNLHKTDPMYEASSYPDEVSIATCSADSTIRLWDLALLPRPEGKHEQTQLTVNQQIYNSEDNELVSSVQLVSCGILEQENVDKELHAQGFRSMAVTSDGQYLAAGDCCGNLHVFNLHTSAYTCIEGAHDAEILSVNFNNKQADNNAESESQCFLVTGSRDRTIHVHNVRRSFDLIESFDDHSAPVTSVILTWDGCNLLSCSADRSVLFRDIFITDVGCKVVRRQNHLASHGTIYDMAIDHAEKLVVTVGQDRRINKYNLCNGKLVASFKEEGDLGQPIKVTVDPSGSYLLCSYSNKSLRIYDFVTGELVAYAMGHAEVVTGSIFLPNCKHIVSVSGDSCIFIWKLPAPLSSKILHKTKENAGWLSTPVATQSTTSLEGTQCKVESPRPNVDSDCGSKAVMLHKEDNGVAVDDGFREDLTFMFSISRLPKWAQTKVASKPVKSQDSDAIISSQVSPSESSNLEIIDKNGPTALGSSFSGDLSPNASSGQDILSCSSQGRIMHSKDLVHLDETDSPEERNSRGTKSLDSFLNSSEELLAEECSTYDVMETISLDVTAQENLTTLSVLENVNVSGGRAECMSSVQGVNTVKERDEDGVSVEKSLSKKSDAGNALATRLDAKKRPLHSQAAEVGGFSNELQCDDLFSQNFGNLSMVVKPEGRLSNRKSLSAHFRVRRDRLSSCKRLSLTATDDHGRVTCAELGGSLDPLIRSIKDAPRQDNINQDRKNDEGLPLSPTCFPQGNEMPRGIDEFREALHKLDEAATTALRLCTELGVLHVSGRKLDGHKTELLALVADTLPSVLEKVQILANLVQVDKVDSGLSYKSEGLDLEPMIERFAESLSQRVLELLRMNI